jgi:putative endonuclease
VPYAVYILANRPNGVLYVGSTSDLVRRVYEHRRRLIPGFTYQYKLTRLVHFEIGDHYAAIAQREKRLKKWRRAWKISLIETGNPEWRDLYDDISS